MTATRVRAVLVLAGGLFAAACAPRSLTLPSGPSSPWPEAAAVFEQASRACRDVRTLTAELGLSARTGSDRLRARLLAGFTRDGAMRLEALAPFGPPALILTVQADDARLVLPRDRRALDRAKPSDVLGAMSGVPLAPADLLAVLDGCVVPGPMAGDGRLYGRGWGAVDLQGGTSVFLRREGDAWQVRAARRPGWDIEYGAWQGRFPRLVRLRSTGPGPIVDATVSITGLEANVDVPDSAFAQALPPDAAPLTIEELRQMGPLRGQPADGQ